MPVLVNLDGNSHNECGKQLRGKSTMKELFGTDQKNGPVYLYTLENENLILKTTDFGAACVSIIDKKTGIDILKGFDSYEGYRDQHDSHLGGSIGRTANRIRNASFALNGKTYHITVNDCGKNNLHGGIGFDRRMFEAEESESSIVYTRLSRDMEEGYPGNLLVKISYILHKDGVEIKAEGTAKDQDTIFAFTNHNYYNIDGCDEDSVLDQQLMIHADAYAENDADGVSLAVNKPVENTPFDFRTFKAVGKDIQTDDAQLRQCHGYDHHFAVNGTGMREFSVIAGKKLEMSVWSDFPGMHVYTANFLSETNGKHHHDMVPHSAICFEPEYRPDGINEEEVLEKPIVRKGENLAHTIRLYIKERD